MASSSLPHYFWPRLQEIELSLNTVVIILETLGKNLRKPKPEKPKKDTNLLPPLLPFGKSRKLLDEPDNQQPIKLQ
jgi:hypothetical protein